MIPEFHNRRTMREILQQRKGQERVTLLNFGCGRAVLIQRLQCHFDPNLTLFLFYGHYIVHDIADDFHGFFIR